MNGAQAPAGWNRYTKFEHCSHGHLSIFYDQDQHIKWANFRHMHTHTKNNNKKIKQDAEQPAANTFTQINNFMTFGTIWLGFR